LLVSVTGEKLDNNVYKLLFAVKDSGIRHPCAAALIRLCINRLARLTASTTRRYGGTGLGWRYANAQRNDWDAASHWGQSKCR